MPTTRAAETQGGAKPRLARVKAGLANVVLVVFSVLVAYAGGEVLVFRYLLPHLSLNLRPHLPDRADFFLQNSKASYVPHNYIALLGDSYAQGMGDWLLSVGGKNDRPYHSANVIHELLGKDVMTLGRAAAGSGEALVLRVTRILRDDYCYVFPPIEQPRQFVVYFFEGNDIYDNVDLIRRAYADRAADLRTGVDTFLDRDYGSLSPWRCHGHLGDMMYRMARFAVRGHFAVHHVIDLPPTKNKVVTGGVVTGTSELLIPPVNFSEQLIKDGVLVYERSLAWLRRHYPDTPTTVVYIPSPAATYRHAGTEVVAKDVYLLDEAKKLGKEVRVDGAALPLAQINALSQDLCEKVRAVSLAAGVSFIDARPELRAGGVRAPVHGPRDWNHLNEAGYRLLGALVARHAHARPVEACDDSWPNS